MDIRARIFVAVLSLGLLIFVTVLVRRKHLKESYAILWVMTAIALTATPFIIDFVDRIAYSMSIYYPPALVYVIAILFLMTLTLHFSVIVSKLSDQNKNLAQNMGILENHVKELEERLVALEKQSDGYYLKEPQDTEYSPGE